MTQTPQNLTLADCQTMIKAMMVERGWNERSAVMQTMMMSEEMGEVAKAVRNIELKGQTPERVEELALELADVLNYVCWLSTLYNVNLESAFIQKFKANKGRTW